MRVTRTILCLLAVGVGLVDWSPADAIPVLWSSGVGGNNHYYDLIADARLTFDNAIAAAAGLPVPAPGYGPGYLVTITSAAEQTFIQTIFGVPFANCGAGNGSGPCTWIGASDRGSVGVWKWVTGPEAGQTFAPAPSPNIPYANWFPGEPNNPGVEDFAIYGWAGTAQWNNLPDSRLAYLVEWSRVPQTVPEPASLLLLASGVAGLAGVGWGRHRRK